MASVSNQYRSPSVSAETIFAEGEERPRRGLKGLFKSIGNCLFSPKTLLLGGAVSFTAGLSLTLTGVGLIPGVSLMAAGGAMLFAGVILRGIRRYRAKEGPSYSRLPEEEEQERSRSASPQKQGATGFTPLYRGEPDTNPYDVDGVKQLGRTYLFTDPKHNRGQIKTDGLTKDDLHADEALVSELGLVAEVHRSPEDVAAMQPTLTPNERYRAFLLEQKSKKLLVKNQSFLSENIDEVKAEAEAEARSERAEAAKEREERAVAARLRQAALQAAAAEADLDAELAQIRAQIDAEEKARAERRAQGKNCSLQ